MPGGEVMRSSAAIDDELPFARVESLSDNLRIIPTAAFCNRKKNRFVARQHLGPPIAALFLPLRQCLRCTSRCGNLQESRTGIGRKDDSVFRCPYRAARSCSTIA